MKPIIIIIISLLTISSAVGVYLYTQNKATTTTTTTIASSSGLVNHYPPQTTQLSESFALRELPEKERIWINSINTMNINPGDKTKLINCFTRLFRLTNIIDDLGGYEDELFCDSIIKPGLDIIINYFKSLNSELKRENGILNFNPEYSLLWASFCIGIMNNAELFKDNNYPIGHTKPRCSVVDDTGNLIDYCEQIVPEFGNSYNDINSIPPFNMEFICDDSGDTTTNDICNNRTIKEIRFGPPEAVEEINSSGILNNIGWVRELGFSGFLRQVDPPGTTQRWGSRFYELPLKIDIIQYTETLRNLSVTQALPGSDEDNCNNYQAQTQSPTTNTAS